jgi:1-phosphofructokinase/tagatose 6-phosphate kinase
MIITVTANAAIDRTLTVPNFQTGFRHRASESLALPGGKGVNVARAVKALGQPVIVTGLVGGRAGQQIVEGLGREGILDDFVRIADESRTSTAVIDPTTTTQTEVIEYGPIVTPAELDALTAEIDHLAKGARYVVLAGSLPRKVPEDYYARVIRLLETRRCFVALDTYGEPLRRGVKAKPWLVTPNIREAEDLVGHEFNSEEDIVDAIGLICDLGAQNAIIKSREGCYARWRRGKRFHFYKATAPRFKTFVATVGSGDAFLAGFIAHRYQRVEPVECLRWGLACAAANTQRSGAGVFDLDEVKRIYERTDVQELESGTID